MTYPKVTIRGENLPDPIDGWDHHESLVMLGDGRQKAVYLPSEFEVETEYLYLAWKSEETTDHRYIYNSQIESFDVEYDHLSDD